ncbi:hypothetical protein TNCV_3037311 [Trichonephila clavipes]|nr:hypothetical protein TNCV_3037311 [Trichonephila clavipes]
MDFETRRKKKFMGGGRVSAEKPTFPPFFSPALSSLSCFRFLFEKRGGAKMVKPKTVEYFLEYLLPESTRASTPPQGKWGRNGSETGVKEGEFEILDKKFKLCYLIVEIMRDLLCTFPLSLLPPPCL